MKKGRINLLSFEGDDFESEPSNFDFDFNKTKQTMDKDMRRPFNKNFVANSNLSASASKSNKNELLDFSQIRDRVIQMDFNEEIVLEGESVEAFLNNDENDHLDLEEDLKFADRIREAKLKRTLTDFDSDLNQDQESKLSDYIPITTKGEYWLNRDTRESEETFNSSTSRLVHEDLFNELEIDDGNDGFTQFFGKDVLGRSGMMMTSKMLKRDIKTEQYDLELDVNSKTDLDSDANDEVSDAMWEQSQVLKGIEKGWNHLESDGNNFNFLSIQAKLSIFIPPKQTINANLLIPSVDLKINSEDLINLEENFKKIEADSKNLEERIHKLKLEIDNSQKFIKGLSEIETFFMRYSRFLSEKIPELQSLEREFEIENLDLDLDVKKVERYHRWECFFDNVDAEDSDLLDLPEIINKFKMIPNYNNIDQKYLAELTGLFVRYHFLAINDTKNIWAVYDESGLSAALSLINNEYRYDLELLGVIFDKILSENGTERNFNRIKGIRDEIFKKICENNIERL